MSQRCLYLAAALSLLSSVSRVMGQSPTTFPSLMPTTPTESPTERPSSYPTTSPTMYPTVSLSNDVLLVEAQVAIRNIDSTDVTDDSLFFALLFQDATGLTNEVDVTVATVTDENEVDGEFDTACNGTGVYIGYEVRTEDVNTYTSIRSSIDTGRFFESYAEDLLNVYAPRVGVCTAKTGSADEIIIKYSELSQDEAYPPEEEPSFAENMWSEYLFMGIILSTFGVVWLWYLRSDVDDDGVYDPKQPNNGSQANVQRAGTNSVGVEMTSN